MIGGIDIHLPTSAGECSLETAAHTIRRFWPDAVVENGTTGDRYSAFADAPFQAEREFFIYRDAASADAWNAEGAVPSLYNTMVHILFDPGCVTLVFDEDGELVRRMTDAVAAALAAEPSCK